ncbi:hypothetical protein F5Y07DRAFT_378027 [Xylaria sp. FL0933]|nr:hypothetical protein F5Y07DRAFT_378027 [Xylaria sp. FL0933]
MLSQDLFPNPTEYHLPNLDFAMPPSQASVIHRAHTFPDYGKVESRGRIKSWRCTEVGLGFQAASITKPEALNEGHEAEEEEELKKFRELASSFEATNTTEDLMKWNIHLRETLNNKEKLIDKYFEFAEARFKLHPLGHTSKDVEEFKQRLRDADWHIGGDTCKIVTSIMEDGPGILSLGRYESFYLVVRLDTLIMYFPPSTVEQLSSREGSLLDDESVLALQYKSLESSNPAELQTLFFFPLGYVSYVTASPGFSEDDFQETIEWRHTDFFLALGVDAETGKTITPGANVPDLKLYLIYQPGSEFGYTGTDADDTDDCDDDNFRPISLRNNPPPFTVAEIDDPPLECLTTGFTWMHRSNKPISLTKISGSNYSKIGRVVYDENAKGNGAVLVPFASDFTDRTVRK